MSPPSRTDNSGEFDVVILSGGADAKLIWGSVGDRSVAVVEQSRVGGACPFVTCVPSKAMLRTARVWQLDADPQQSALFTGRVPAAEAYRLACERRDAIVHHRDDTLNAEALQRTGALLVRGHGSDDALSTTELPASMLGFGPLLENPLWELREALYAHPTH